MQPRSQQLRSVDQWQKIRADVERIPDVIGVTPVVTGPGFARRGEATKSVSIIGIEPESYFDVIALPEKIVAGRYDVGPHRHRHRHRAREGSRHRPSATSSRLATASGTRVDTLT